MKRLEQNVIQGPSKILDRKWREKDAEKHKQRLRNIQDGALRNDSVRLLYSSNQSSNFNQNSSIISTKLSQIDNYDSCMRRSPNNHKRLIQPRQLMPIQTRNGKKEQIEIVRNKEIQKENMVLLNKMSDILQSSNPNIVNPNYHINKKSLNYIQNRRQITRILTENEQIMHRLQSKQSNYSVRQWENEFKEQQQHKERIKVMPYQFGDYRKYASTKRSPRKLHSPNLQTQRIVPSKTSRRNQSNLNNYTSKVSTGKNSKDWNWMRNSFDKTFSSQFQLPRLGTSQNIESDKISSNQYNLDGKQTCGNNESSNYRQQRQNIFNQSMNNSQQLIDIAKRGLGFTDPFTPSSNVQSQLIESQQISRLQQRPQIVIKQAQALNPNRVILYKCTKQLIKPAATLIQGSSTAESSIHHVGQQVHYNNAKSRPNQEYLKQQHSANKNSEDVSQTNSLNMLSYQPSGDYRVEVSRCPIKNNLVIAAYDIESPESLLIEIDNEQKVDLILRQFNNDYDELTDSLQIINKRLVLLNPKFVDKIKQDLSSRRSHESSRVNEQSILNTINTQAIGNGNRRDSIIQIEDNNINSDSVQNDKAEQEDQVRTDQDCSNNISGQCEVQQQSNSK